VRRLFDAGVLINVSSDSPAYVESNWIVDNLRLLKMTGGFTDEEIVKLQMDSVDMCWASEDVKGQMRADIEHFVEEAVFR
jgi:adenosine deaminase